MRRRRTNSFRTLPCAGKQCWPELLLARIALRMNDVTSRTAHCEAARAELEKLDSPLLAVSSRVPDGRNSIAPAQGRARLPVYRRAREAVEHLRGNLRGEELKIAFFQNKLEVYENLVDLCLRRPGSFEEAFNYIEQAKSRALMDLLSAVGARPQRGRSRTKRTRTFDPQFPRRTELVLQPDRTRAVAAGRTLPGKNQTTRATSACAGSRPCARVERSHALPKRTRPGLHVASSISLEQIRAAMPADTALVEYFRIQDRIRCLCT